VLVDSDTTDDPSTGFAGVEELELVATLIGPTGLPLEGSSDAGVVRVEIGARVTGMTVLLVIVTIDEFEVTVLVRLTAKSVTMGCGTDVVTLAVIVGLMGGTVLLTWLVVFTSMTVTETPATGAGAAAHCCCVTAVPQVHLRTDGQSDCGPSRSGVGPSTHEHPAKSGLTGQLHEPRRDDPPAGSTGH
jgi:hypothetical protein